MKLLSLSAFTVLGLLLASCHTASQWDLIATRLRAPNGAVIIFDPATCEVTSRFFAELNLLDASPNARVLGLLLDTDTVSTPLSAVAQDFGIGFRLELASRHDLAPVLDASPLRLPLLLVYRFGALAAIESVEPGRGTMIRYITDR